MNLPPICIIEASDDHVNLTINVSTDLEAFHGHFPNYPILPGVVQIDWVIRLARLHLGIADSKARDFQVKFRNIIRPLMPLTLTLQMDRSKNHLSFAYQSGEKMMALGTVRLGTQ